MFSHRLTQQTRFSSQHITSHHITSQHLASYPIALVSHEPRLYVHCVRWRACPPEASATAVVALHTQVIAWDCSFRSGKTQIQETVCNQRATSRYTSLQYPFSSISTTCCHHLHDKHHSNTPAYTRISPHLHGAFVCSISPTCLRSRSVLEFGLGCRLRVELRLKFRLRSSPSL